MKLLCNPTFSLIVFILFLIDPILCWTHFSIPAGDQQPTTAARQQQRQQKPLKNHHPSPSSSSVVRLQASSIGSSTTGSSSTTETSLSRALEISRILFGDVVSPLLASLVSEGLPENGGEDDDWDKFWARSSDDNINGSPMTNGLRLAKALEDLGPTYVKFGQALGSRPDVVPPSLAEALSTLQDNMEPFSSETAKAIISKELIEACRDSGCPADRNAVDALVRTLSEEPVAAASIGQVYKAVLPDYGEVAVKVQRPGIQQIVERDAALLRTVATWVESLSYLQFLNQQQTTKTKSRTRLINTNILDAVDEFMSRIFEEMDYRREANNLATFAGYYSYHNGTSPGNVRVVVPEILFDYCTENVLVMEWLDGTKLTTVTSSAATAAAQKQEETETLEENLALVKVAIDATLSQLLVTGILHADPHAGNLIKTPIPSSSLDHNHKKNKRRRKKGSSNTNMTLGYLDFGLLSTIPESVRNALVCSVVQLVFANDVEAVASLFGELDLLPQEILDDDEERAALTAALEKTMSECLVYPTTTINGDSNGDDTKIPELKFDKLLDALSRLVPRFQFQLPPYFINNARALSTLEGIAKSLDPSFNVLQIMYPFTLLLLLENPTQSPVVDATLQSLIRRRKSGSNRVSRRKLEQLLRDAALITGYRKRRVVWDVLQTKGGRKLVRRITAEELNHRLMGGRIGRGRRKQRLKEQQRRRQQQSEPTVINL